MNVRKRVATIFTLTFRYFPLLMMCAFLCGVATRGVAQTANTGAITGIITDQAGAVVQKAEVTITSATTGEMRRAITEMNGVYRVSLLPPGSYRIEAGKSGFKQAVRSGVPVAVTEITSLNIELVIGANSETVTVNAEPQMTQTESNALGRVTDQRSIEGLPLVTRNFTQIIGLSPGVSVGLTDASQLGTGNGGMSNYSNEDLSVNGARNYDNNFQMDGVTANDLTANYQWSGGIAIPNPDSIVEFKVLTGQYDASYGHNAGANVNVITKSGGNQFHGNVFEFFRNEDLNANSYFFKADGVARGILRQNQFGGTLGGPIVKDKLLFFASYQGNRQLNGVATGVLGGCGASFTGPALTNDRSAAALGALYAGQAGAFGGVAVAADGSNVNPVALALLNLKLPDGTYVVPTPQVVANGEGQYAFSDPCTFHENQFVADLDYLQTSKSKVSAKFFLANQGYTQTMAGSINVPGSPDHFTPHFRNVSLTHDYILGANTLNQLEFGFHRTVNDTNNSSSFTYPEIGATVIPQGENMAGICIGPECVGAFASTAMATTVYTLQDTLTYARGPHNLRFGGGFTRTDMPYYWFQSSNMLFLSMPDVLLGQSAAQNGTSFSNLYASYDFPGVYNRDWLVWNGWAYAQDDWKITRSLTLNLGLRYERLGLYADRFGRNSSFDVSLADPNPTSAGSQAGYLLPSNYSGGVPIPQGSVQLKNRFAIDGNGQDTFGPRVGFAWQVRPRYVLRGGYGTYYSAIVGTPVGENIFSAPWGTLREIVGTANAAATLANPFGQLLAPSDFPIFPAYSPSTQLDELYLRRDARPGVTQQYSLNLQTQIAQDYLLEIGFVGSRGTHQMETLSVNQAQSASATNPIRGETTNTVANIPLRVPVEGFLAYGLASVQADGNSWYNALQTSVTKRFSHGFQFLASYTYARLFDTEGGDTINVSQGVGYVPGNQNSPKARYGPASFVRPHRFVVSFVYELPKYPSNGFAGAALSNWTLSGVETILSGHPLTITNANPNNAYGISSDFAELASGCTRSQLVTPGSVEKKLSSYLNANCIGAYPVIGDDGVATGFGNMSPGLVNGPGMSNLDLALIKRFPVRWFDFDSNWEFRAEAFNAFNTAHFGDPNTNVSNGPGVFGVVSQTIANPRVMQLALKYNF